MAAGISGFRSPEGAARYYEAYDDFAARLWPVPHTEIDVQTRFGLTHVRQSGPADGVPIVLIHPTSGSSVGWYPLIDTLCARHPVYTPDTIGTAGRSVQTAPVTSPEDLVAWLDDVLDGRGIEHVHLVGYSEGGWIAGLHAAITDRPGRLTTLTLIEPAGAIERVPPLFLATLILRGARTLIARDKHKAVRSFNQWMNGDTDLTDEQIDLLLLGMRSFRQKLPTPKRLTDEQLRRITMPTLMLLGADTKLYDPVQLAARAKALLADVTVEVTAGAGHGVVFQHADRVTARILDFVDNAASVPSDESDAGEDESSSDDDVPRRGFGGEGHAECDGDMSRVNNMLANPVAVNGAVTPPSEPDGEGPATL